MSVARFIADQRTMHGVPHAVLLRDPGRQRLLVLQVVAPGTDAAYHAAVSSTPRSRPSSRRPSTPTGHRGSTAISSRPAGR